MRVLAGFIAVSLAGLPAMADAPSVHVVRIDGTSFQAKWVGSDGHTVQLFTDQQLSMPFEELSSVRFPAAVSDGTTDTPLFHLADGGRLAGEIVSGEGDTVVANTSLGRSVSLPFRALAGIRLVQGEEYVQAAELFDAALESRLPGQDVLITRGPEEFKALRGRLEGLGPAEGSFVFADRARTFQNEKIYGVVFAAGIARPASYSVTVETADGSRFSGDIESADAEKVRVKASFGVTVEVELGSLVRLSVRSSRVEYVSELRPVKESVEGIVHRPWPVRVDRSVSAKPLSIGGRVFDKGLGVHSRTALAYDISGGYETFVATIGLDDTVRPLGNVVFRVEGDGQVLFDSGTLTGGDEPRDIRVNVSGVKTMTLVVDYGEGLDISDQADWGGARLLKPASATKERNQ